MKKVLVLIKNLFQYAVLLGAPISLYLRAKPDERGFAGIVLGFSWGVGFMTVLHWYAERRKKRLDEFFAKEGQTIWQMKGALRQMRRDLDLDK